MPSIHNFNRYDNRDNPFAIFEYMNVQPSLHSLQFFQKLCDSARLAGVRLPRNYLLSEQKVYMAIKNNEYVNYRYEWE